VSSKTTNKPKIRGEAAVRVKTNPGGPGARKAIVDVAEVERLASLFMNWAQIAYYLGISLQTLDRRKQENAELVDAYYRGQAKTRAMATTKLMKAIQSDEPWAIKFIHLTKLGFSYYKDGEGPSLNVNIDARQDNRKQTVIMSGDALSAQLMDYEDVLRTDGAVTKALTAKVPGNGEGSVPGNGEVHDAGSESDVIEAEVEGDPQ